MSEQPDRDYVLGTHDEEIERLGLQHRVWRARMLECWQRAGIAAGWRVLDVGAGPGYATLDLAEIVGSAGEVIAIERSTRFLDHARQACAQRGFSNVRFREIDLNEDLLDPTGLDAAWCRWVGSFVSSPATLVAKLASTLKIGGAAIFHEYVDYQSWRMSPRGQRHEEFVSEVVASWRASGGEPDVARALPRLLCDSGFEIRHVAPIVLAVRPTDVEWQWPKTFIEINLGRLLELGRVKPEWAESVRQEQRAAEADPATIMLTPMMLEIIAERRR
ncbi:MAG: class I SAM-dependent methyltransferase [Acidobacteria bacterium]|nr:class I SAM-dependent methyltransferase [Acidobacteriota bacterium]